MKRVYICPKCDYTGSIEEGNAVPPCPKCGHEMADSGLDRDTFRCLTDEEKTALRNAVKSTGNSASFTGGLPEDVKRKLEEACEQTRKIREAEEERARKAREEADRALKTAAGQIYDVDMDAIDPKVAAYLKKTAKYKLDSEAAYRNSVLQSCGFTHPERKEVPAGDPHDKTETDAAGVTHYYTTRQVADDVTPEEFDLILKASGRSKNPEDSKVSSGAAVFFTVVTVILWLFGLITSILLAEAASRSVRFETFMNAFLPFFFYGCLTMCAAELFRRLAKIQSILTSIKNKLYKED